MRIPGFYTIPTMFVSPDHSISSNLSSTAYKFSHFWDTFFQRRRSLSQEKRGPPRRPLGLLRGGQLIALMSALPQLPLATTAAQSSGALGRCRCAKCCSKWQLDCGQNWKELEWEIWVTQTDVMVLLPDLYLSSIDFFPFFNLPHTVN